MKMKLTLSLLLIFSQLVCIGQEAKEGHKKNKVMLVMGHTHVSKGFDSNNQKSWIVLPSWGLDYDRQINEKWALGVHTDWVTESFSYEDADNIELERTRPFAAVLVVSRRIGEHLTLLAGGGFEVAPEENLTLIRAGIDYGWELRNDWEIAVNLMSDFKLEAYDSWVLGLGIAKRF